MPIGIGVILIDGEYTVESALNAIEGNTPSPATGTTGITQYSSRQRNRIRMEKQITPAPRKLGVMIRVYDPMLVALLGGE